MILRHGTIKRLRAQLADERSKRLHAELMVQRRDETIAALRHALSDRTNHAHNRAQPAAQTQHTERATHD